MKSNWKRAVALLLMLVLVATLCLGCGDEEEGVTIAVGEIIDLSGPASPAVIPVHQVIEDLVRHYNDEDLIPGAKMKLVTYDCQFNPARDIPGYEWCRERGAKVILGIHNTTSETVKPFAERDKVAVGTVTHTQTIAEPPGWVFVFSSHSVYHIQRLLKWISEEHWDYEAKERVPKIGFVGWRESMGMDIERAMREYSQAHPNEFEWVGGFLPPMGTMTYYGEIEKLKDCDYIEAHAYVGAAFIRDFRAKGYDATFIGEGAAVGYHEFYVETAGWEALDGMLTANIVPWWNQPVAAVDLVRGIAREYRSGPPEELGASYLGAFFNLYGFFEILRQAVEEVGAENFDGEAFYDVAVKYKMTLEGLPEWDFTETKRYIVNAIQVYEWRAEVEDMVRMSGWLPIVDLAM